MYPESKPAKWLVPFRGPQRQVLVAGVEVKATQKTLCTDTFTLVPLLVSAANNDPQLKGTFVPDGVLPLC